MMVSRHGATEERHPSGYAGPARPEDGRRWWPDARIRDHGAHPARLGRPAARRGRLSLPRPAPHGPGRLAARGVGYDGEEPPGALLHHHQGGPEAARDRGRELGAAVQRRGACTRIRLNRPAGGPPMSWLARLRNVFRADEVSEEIEREMAFHLAERTDELVAAGASPEAARREAERRFGSDLLQRDNTRDRDVLVWLETLLGDFRYGLRALRRSPVFCLAAILT